MTKPIVVANWKMNLRPKESVDLAHFFIKEFKETKNLDIVICPSFAALALVGAVIDNDNIKLGAQDVFWVNSGAFTGEVSPTDLTNVGCRYVIIGHSERRLNLGETDEMVNKKVLAALAAGLVPIICVGESLEEKNQKRTDNIIYHQLEKAINNLHLVGGEQLVIAYEPIWAIGTGQVVETDDASHVFSLINQILVDHFPKSIVNDSTRLIYGGSVDAKTSVPFIGLPLMSGFLVGGASLKTNEFAGIVSNFKK